MTMRYWHVEHDVGWIPGETKKEDVFLYKTLMSDGPHWSREAFFDDNYVSVNYGPLAAERMVLHFSKKNRKAIVPTFVDGFSVLTCSARDFALFVPLFGQDLVKYKFKIDDIPYTSFRSTKNFNLLDIGRSRFKDRRDNGEPCRFSHISLLSPPSPECDFFSLTWPYDLTFDAIVSDRFKAIYDDNKMTGLFFNQCFPALE